MRCEAGGYVGFWQCDVDCGKVQERCPEVGFNASKGGLVVSVAAGGVGAWVMAGAVLVGAGGGGAGDFWGGVLGGGVGLGGGGGGGASVIKTASTVFSVSRTTWRAKPDEMAHKSSK